MFLWSCSARDKQRGLGSVQDTNLSFTFLLKGVKTGRPASDSMLVSKGARLTLGQLRNMTLERTLGTLRMKLELSSEVGHWPGMHMALG